MRKLRLWQKIILFASFVLVCLILLITPILNFYIKHSLTKNLNNSLSAEVKIEKLRINFLRSKILISGFYIKEQVSDHNNCLFSLDKISIDLEKFDRDKKLLSFSEIRLEKPELYMIIDESGNNLWAKIFPQEKLQSNMSKNNIDMQGFNVIAEKIIIENAAVHHIDKKKKLNNSIENLFLTIKSAKHKKHLSSTYALSANIFSDYPGCNYQVEFIIEGNSEFSRDKKYLTAENSIGINSFNFVNKINVKASEQENEITEINFFFDINDYSEQYYRSGLLEIDILAKGIFDNDKFSISQAAIIADSIILQNSAGKDTSSIIADFTIEYTQTNYEKYSFSIISQGVFLRLNDDIICGSAFFDLDENGLIARNNISGSLNLKELNGLLSDNIHLTSGTAVINEDYKNNCSLDNSLFYNSFRFALEDLEIIYCSNKPLKVNILSLELADNSIIFENNIHTTKINNFTKLKITDIHNYLANEVVEIELTSEMNKIRLPKTGNRKIDISELTGEKPTYKIFSDVLASKIILKIDTVIFDDKLIFNNVYSLHFSPDAFIVDNFYSEIASGSVSGILDISEKDGNRISYLKMDVTDVDLSYFSNDETELSGKLNIISENKLFNFKKGYSEFNGSSGQTELYLTDFSLNSGKSRNFSLGQDNLKIDSLGIDLKLSGEKLTINPFQTFLNNISINTRGELYLIKDSLSIITILKIPASELDKNTKFAIRAITGNKKINRGLNDTDNMNLFLHLNGSLSSPDFEIFEIH